ncbi:MAG: hypothetical protein ACI87O_000732 [Planctomycetota bacterium]|jgi:hypothetical protein
MEVVLGLTGNRELARITARWSKNHRPNGSAAICSHSQRNKVRRRTGTVSTNGLKTNHPRRGSAAWILVLILALMAAGLVAWMTLQEPSTDPGLTRVNPTGIVQPDQDPTSDLQPLIEEVITPSGRVEVGPLPYRDMQRVFDGTGQISGELFPSESVAMPETWTLVIEPSKFAVGRERAIRKELEFSGNQTTFEVRDLPMASYRVYAVAQDQASIAMEISLFRIEGPGHRVKNHSHIMLRLEPLSSLHVTVQTADLYPATELPLFLDSAVTLKRWKAQTNAAGRYEFQDLPAGTFKLMVGYPDHPLVPIAQMQVVIGKPTFWEGVLPKTHPVTFQVIDAAQRPLPGAIVRGHGGAPVDGITDFEGQYTQRYLPEGSYTIRVAHKESEGNGRINLTIPLEGSQPEPVIIYCQQ